MRSPGRATILALLAILTGALALFVVAQRHEPEIVIARDLVYGKGADTELHLDLAMPKLGVGPFPAVIFLHGGGWIAGTRQHMNHLIEGMARMGYVAIAVEYRLAPSARFPAQIEDCKAAVRWLRANAEKYRVRSDRIGVVGFSAGGHLAAMLGVTGKEDGFEGLGGNPEQSSRVQAVVSFFGPTDFSARYWPKYMDDEVIAPFLGGSFADRSEIYTKASPVNYVTAEAPPFLFLHGTEDKLVPIDQSRRLAEKLTKLGVPAEMVALEGEGHGFTDDTNQKAMQQMLDFLSERLKP